MEIGHPVSPLRLDFKMPEGPELHLASRFVNRVCSGTVFAGQVEKSAVSKNCEVPFKCDAYLISAVSRGKEVKLTLTPIKEEDGKEDMKPTATEDEDRLLAPMDVTFRFGMSGSFKLTNEDEVPKHAHLKFFTKGKPTQVLCFVDPRRFGSWEVNGTWQSDRGPCVLLEYEKFRYKCPSFPSEILASPAGRVCVVCGCVWEDWCVLCVFLCCYPMTLYL
ncbi:hypothetical protein scyTo_0017227 [Scyliorhinus torazame]|uniref:Formamidopyrimidine-DNA glycosylase catalytic domain-containing protein n=1 Tax=Scyliorhinus torazame TaxID=75743 RepID=A0A401Q5D0_SCYTO|nr:hypothetical protein [Scyliorhinus torazame]